MTVIFPQDVQPISAHGVALHTSLQTALRGEDASVYVRCSPELASKHR